MCQYFSAHQHPEHRNITCPQVMIKKYNQPSIHLQTFDTTQQPFQTQFVSQNAESSM